MEKWYRGGSSRISSKSKAKVEEDFQEEEVWAEWAVMKEREGSNLRSKKPASRIPTASRRIQSRVNSGSSSHGEVLYQASAPMSIPDWSTNIHYRKKSNMGFSKVDSWAAAAAAAANVGNSAAADDDYEDSDEMVPPHEIVARRLARSPIVSFSMCEGVGRTLKGRDLSKLRNSILTKTGFLE